LTRPQSNPRRSYGTGSLFTHRGKWYGQWRVGGQQVKRAIGPKRQPGSREGLTRKQAEVELRRLMHEVRPVATGNHLTVSEVGERLLLHLGAIGRKPTTLATYRSQFNTHLLPHLGAVPVDRATPEQIEGLIAEMRRSGSSAKTIVNALTLLHQIFAFAQRKRWCEVNPCEAVDRPRVEDSTEIHFLTADEIEALLRAVPLDHPYGPTDHALYLTAVMSGLRQGELLALRWRDIDWMAGRVRVRRNYVRGHWVTPKSKRGIRSVPLADRLAGELERHFQRSNYPDDDNLVFPHPHTGEVLDHSTLVRRFKAALRAGKVRQVRFNDLRHSFATAMAAAGVPMRTLQEWMGHRDFKTTLIYADYAPSAGESELIERAFAAGTNPGTKLSTRESNSDPLKPPA
jgi:integrase